MATYRSKPISFGSPRASDSPERYEAVRAVRKQRRREASWWRRGRRLSTDNWFGIAALTLALITFVWLITTIVGS
jgi:hypothetical protein